MAVINTGASVSMMGRPFYQKVQQVRALKLQTHDMPRLEGVGGNPVPTLGCAEVEVGIAAGVYKTPVVARRVVVSSSGQCQERKAQFHYWG